MPCVTRKNWTTHNVQGDDCMHVSEPACRLTPRTQLHLRVGKLMCMEISRHACVQRAQDKLDLYVQRLYVLQQRMRRMPMFSAPVYSKLRPVERDFCEVPHRRILRQPDSNAEGVSERHCRGGCSCNVCMREAYPEEQQLMQCRPQTCRMEESWHPGLASMHA